MSDSQRSRRAKPKPVVETDVQDAKQVREELARMLQRDTPQPYPQRAPTKRSWEIFDDLPEQAPRAPVLPSTRPIAPPERPTPPSTRAAPRPARAMLDERAEDRPRYSPIAESRAALHDAESNYGSAWSSLPTPPGYTQLRGKPWLMLVIGVASIAVIVMLMMPQRTTLTNVHSPAPEGESQPASPAAPAPNGEHSIVRAPTLTAGQIDAVLRDYNSPAAGTGNDWVTLGQKYDIDPAYALAFFVVESTAGTAQGWAGWKPDGSSTHNIGNIICAGYDTCFGRFRDYGSWQEGIEDWYKLISVEYVNGRGLQTVEQIIPIYAPSFENDVDSYVNNVEGMVAKWRMKRG